MSTSERDWENFEKNFEKKRIEGVARDRKRRLEEAAKLGGGISDETGATVSKIVVGTFVLGGLYALFSSRSRKTKPAQSASTSVKTSEMPAVPSGHMKVTPPKGKDGQLRAAAGPDSDRLATFKSGTVVQVVGSADVDGERWYQIKAPTGDVGWMSGKILS